MRTMTAYRLAPLLVCAIGLFGCASAPNTEDLNTNVVGMSKQELLSCMGPPSRSAQDGNMEFLTYSHRSYYDKYTYECEARFVLTNGRISKLNVTGDPPGTLDVSSGVCRSLVAKCTR